MRVLFLLTLALIVYGSFYPWQFYDRELPANPLWILLHAWPPAFIGAYVRDAVLNFFLYIPLGAVGALALRQERPAWLRFVVPVLAGGGLSIAVELGQLYTWTRTTNALDVVTNTAGTVAGVILSTLVPVRNHWAERLRRQPDIVLLCALWLAWQSFPVLPALTRPALYRKLRTLLESRLDLADVWTAMFAWLALACAVGRVLPLRAALLALALLTAAIPARLAIYTRQLTLSELAGTAAAVLLWAVWLRSARSRLIAVAAAGVLALAARELLPWRWISPAEPFGWIPFQATIESDALTALTIVFEKLFLYAAVVWTASAAGLGLLRSALATALALFAFELVQRHLLYRTPEATDSLLALLAGAIFAAVRRGAAEKQ